MRRILFVFTAAAMAALAACSDVPPPPSRQPISFTQYSPFDLEIASVDIVEEYRSPMRAPNAEHLFPTAPAEAMRIWVNDRIRAVGGGRTLQVIIKDASVIEEPLPVTPGLRGSFTNDQAERYNARLEVELRIYGETGAMSEASINAVATRSDTAAENFSLARRDELFNRMLRDLMTVMNAELERNMQQYFSNYIRYSM